ncbi:MAG: hypothetical protein Q9218_004743 [Villophora microphyllina]
MAQNEPSIPQQTGSPELLRDTLTQALEQYSELRLSLSDLESHVRNLEKQPACRNLAIVSPTDQVLTTRLQNNFAEYHARGVALSNSIHAWSDVRSTIETVKGMIFEGNLAMSLLERRKKRCEAVFPNSASVSGPAAPAPPMASYSPYAPSRPGSEGPLGSLPTLPTASRRVRRPQVSNSKSHSCLTKIQPPNRGFILAASPDDRETGGYGGAYTPVVKACASGKTHAIQALKTQAMPAQRFSSPAESARPQHTQRDPRRQAATATKRPSSTSPGKRSNVPSIKRQRIDRSNFVYPPADKWGYPITDPTLDIDECGYPIVPDGAETEQGQRSANAHGPHPAVPINDQSSHPQCQRHSPAQSPPKADAGSKTKRRPYQLGPRKSDRAWICNEDDCGELWPTELLARSHAKTSGHVSIAPMTEEQLQALEEKSKQYSDKRRPELEEELRKRQQT